MKYLILIGVLGLGLQGVAQNTKSVVLKHTRQVMSIDPDDTNFEDLKFLKEQIGSRSIVFLGEQDHGDAATFHAKTRLVKYLNQHMNFDVIAFESDFFGIQTAWEELDTLGIDTVLANIYPMWTGCVQATELFNFIKEKAATKKPLIVAGIDSRHVMSSYARRGYHYRYMTQLLNDLGPSVSEHDSCARYLTVMKEAVRYEYRSKATTADKELYYAFTKRLTAALGASSLPRKTFALQEVQNMTGHIRNGWQYVQGKRDSIDIRDAQMADNLLWLAKKRYPGKKIMVWAQNSHNAKNGYEVILTDKDEDFRPIKMGTILNDTIGKDMYVMGFTSYSGKGGRITVKDKFEIPPPTGDSFEQWLHSAKYNYAFTDMTEVKVDKPNWFLSKLYHHDNEMKGNWGNLYDGVFYIEQMFPCDRK